jgi:hypothetical protein
MTRATPIAALALLSGVLLSAQEIAGVWRGTLMTPRGEGIPYIIRIEKDWDNRWQATYYPGLGSDGYAADSVTLQGSTLKFRVSELRFSYEGTISDNAASITGIRSQGGSRPLNLERATGETSWLRDTSQHDVQFIAVEDHVELEVLDWGGSGRPLVLLPGDNTNATYSTNLRRGWPAPTTCTASPVAAPALRARLRRLMTTTGPTASGTMS